MADSSRLPNLLAAALMLSGMIWLGYRRRRETWTRQSWQRFGLLLALSSAALVAALGMARGVDQGVYEGMAPAWRRTYFYLMTGLLICGGIATFGLVLWFVRGDPHRQVAIGKPASGDPI